MKITDKHPFVIFILFICLFYMCTYPNKEIKEKNKAVVGVSDDRKSDSSPHIAFGDFVKYFDIPIDIADSVFSETYENDCKEIPLRLLIEITGLDLDTLHFANKSCALGNLSSSTSYYSLFYKITCLAGAKCEIFYISNFTNEGALFFNEKIAINRTDMNNEQENFFRFIEGKGLQVKTVVSYYDDSFEFIGDTIFYKQIFININNLAIKEFSP